MAIPANCVLPMTSLKELLNALQVSSGGVTGIRCVVITDANPTKLANCIQLKEPEHILAECITTDGNGDPALALIVDT